MITKGIRGAITVEKNTPESVQSAVNELMTQLIKDNQLDEDKVSHVIFTTTLDINSAYPAKFLRQDIGWNKTALMCLSEMPVENSLKMCIRVLVVYNCEENFEPKFIYLKGARDLRK